MHMQDEINARSYTQEVQDLARQIRDEAREYDSDVEDVLHETVDGHRWVIYTHLAMGVMQYTDHENAIEDYGPPSMEGGWAAHVSRAAYAALAADVRAALSDLEDEDEDEENEEVEEEEDETLGGVVAGWSPASALVWRR